MVKGLAPAKRKKGNTAEGRWERNGKLKQVENNSRVLVLNRILHKAEVESGTLRVLCIIYGGKSKILNFIIIISIKHEVKRAHIKCFPIMDVAKANGLFAKPFPIKPVRCISIELAEIQLI